MTVTLPNIVFHRQPEPRENAFTILVPEGWLLEGGVFRLNPATGSVQAAAANVDMAAKNNPAGSVMVRSLPSYFYWDPRRTAGGPMGMLPFGSSYKGMPVYPVMPPQQFLAQLAFPYAHQGQQIVRPEIVDQKDRPDLLQHFLSRVPPGSVPQGTTHAAGEVTYRYTENNVRYTERAYAVVRDMGPMAMGMWSNHDTWFIRAPEHEFAIWEPVLRTIQASIKVNPAWQQDEQRAQQIATGILNEQQRAEQYRARKALQHQREMQAIDNEIGEHRRETFAEIRNDQYLTLTNKEEYVNPYTNEVDTASNQWAHRWVTSDGREFYTEEEGTNPNNNPELGQWEWKKTPVRPRGP